MSHLSFSTLEFSTNFCSIKSDLSGNTVWPQASGFEKLVKMNHFWHFWSTFFHSKCKRSSLRLQCWMRLFGWFSNTVSTESLCFALLLVNCNAQILVGEGKTFQLFPPLKSSSTPMKMTQILDSTEDPNGHSHVTNKMESMMKPFMGFSKMFSRRNSAFPQRRVKIDFSQNGEQLPEGSIETISAGGGKSPGHHEGGGLTVKVKEDQAKQKPVARKTQLNFFFTWWLFSYYCRFKSHPDCMATISSTNEFVVFRGQQEINLHFPTLP